MSLLVLLKLNYFFLKFSIFIIYFFFKNMFQNTSNVPISVETGSDTTTINESKRDVKQNLQEHSK